MNEYIHMMVRTISKDWTGTDTEGWSSICQAPWFKVLNINNVTWNVTEVTCPDCLNGMGHADFGEQNTNGGE